MMKVKPGSAPVIAADAQAKSTHAVDFARKWSLPVIAVVVLGIASIFVATKLAEPNGPTVPQAATESVSAPTSSKPALTPPASMEANRVDSQTSPAVPPKSEVANPVRAARVVEGAPEPDLTQSGNGIPSTAARSAGPPAAAGTGGPPIAAAKTNANIKSRTDATSAVPVPANATPDRSSLRCSRIMEKATLGEALSTEEKRELASSCR
jgi:hypothetical protein